MATTGGDDGIDVIGLVDVADGDARDTDFVADAIGGRPLEHAAIDRLFVLADLACRALAGGMTDLHAHFRAIVGMDEIDDTLPGAFLGDWVEIGLGRR